MTYAVGADYDYEFIQLRSRRRQRSLVLPCFLGGVALGCAGLAGAWQFGLLPDLTPKAIIASAMTMPLRIGTPSQAPVPPPAKAAATTSPIDAAPVPSNETPPAAKGSNPAAAAPAQDQRARASLAPPSEGAAPDRVAMAYAAAARVMTKGDPNSPLFDTGFSLGIAPAALGQSTPLASTFRPVAPFAVATAPADAGPEVAESRPGLADSAPLPVPRPRGLGGPEVAATPVLPTEQRTVHRRLPRRSQVAIAPAAPAPESRNLFQRLFGFGQQQEQQARGPQLAYAAPNDGGIGASSPMSKLIPDTPRSAGGGTAIYDIAAKTVYMPNGERLEAHSGLGEKMDDPRHVHVRMKGATPPHTYDLTLRESLFHGVQAIRLTPVGGAGAIYGRAGLLAHSYMLGPNGQSNGCVSFRDYNKFLQAYHRGEVRRLVVVARSN
ncbi:DUF2778 domain-containing protein [Chelatococcus reniformis]|uniref:Tlde1 domain-containing protein n=1 Tax=Chelatococcus reniformis TaxID=1494448 RepID=A0A916U4W4_9HYPH|nr:DUF2778 domain-containing protein [Chelatococcus reniformis]GGC59549.1 hypothetical protein GCM10010994_17870 [Chelatococcus reniformis]